MLLGAYAFTWAFHLPIARRDLSTRTGTGFVLYRLGLPGPTLAAIAVAVAAGMAGDLARRLAIAPGALTWSLLAAGLMPAVYLVAAGLVRWNGKAKGNTGPLWHHPRSGWRSLLLTQLYVVLSEEIGWRGLALPLLAAAFGSAGGALLLGPIWALWHLPMFQVPSSHQRGAFLPYAYDLTAWSVLMAGFVFAAGGSVWPAMAFHAAGNIAYFTMKIPPAAEPVIRVLLGLIALIFLWFFPEPLLGWPG